MPRASVRSQFAIIAALAGQVAVVGLIADLLQRVPMLGFVAQIFGVAYWLGAAIWLTLAAVVVMVLAGVLARWWSVLPIGWIVAGLVLHAVSVQCARAIADDLAAGNRWMTATTGIAPPAPAPVNASGTTLLGYLLWDLQPRNPEGYYRVAARPCGPRDRQRERPGARRMLPLLAGLERHTATSRRPSVPICLADLHGRTGSIEFTIEERPMRTLGTWQNPRRGIQTGVRIVYHDADLATFYQGMVDALAPFLFVSRGCTYSLMAELRGCAWFAITQPAARIG